MRFLRRTTLFLSTYLMVGLVSLLIAAECAQPPEACECLKPNSVVPAARSFWTVESSDNFTVCCPPGTDPSAVIKSCEEARLKIAKFWHTDKAAWTRKCYIVLHPTASSYKQFVGLGASQSSGCSTLEIKKGVVVARRIDLRLDRPDTLIRILPHELSHIILADENTEKPLPKWADEGMAMLMDPPEKRAGHRADALNAKLLGRAMRLDTLLTTVGYPEPELQATFYGQSLVLAEYLVAAHGTNEFKRFMKTSAKFGANRALAEVYGYSISDLEQNYAKRIVHPPLMPNKSQIIFASAAD